MNAGLTGGASAAKPGDAEAQHVAPPVGHVRAQAQRIGMGEVDLDRTCDRFRHLIANGLKTNLCTPSTGSIMRCRGKFKLTAY